MNKCKTMLMSPGRVRIAETDLPELNVGEVLIASNYTAISPGTESRCLAGLGVPAGEFVPGYALVGKVVASNDDAVAIGTTVFCPGSQAVGEFPILWGGHVGLAVSAAGRAFPLPSGISAKIAALSALGSIALHGVRLAEVGEGDRVLCVGLGAIGQFSARLAKAYGASVGACDLSAQRVAAAAAAGIAAEQVNGQGLLAAARHIFPDGVDVVIDATGAIAAIAETIGALKDIPWDNSHPNPNRYVVQGSYTGDFPLPYDPLFRKEVGVFTPRNYQRSDLELFLQMLADGRVGGDGLVGAGLPPEKCGEGYSLVKDPNFVGTVVFDWN